MNVIGKAIAGAVLGLLVSSGLAADGKVGAGCTYGGKRLYGKVQKVNAFADLKIEVVNSFPDLKVQVVNAFPDACGKWEWVNSFPDFTVEVVTSFPDIKIQYVNAFPGPN